MKTKTQLIYQARKYFYLPVDTGKGKSQELEFIVRFSVITIDSNTHIGNGMTILEVKTVQNDYDEADTETTVAGDYYDFQVVDRVAKDAGIDAYAAAKKLCDRISAQNVERYGEQK